MLGVCDPSIYSWENNLSEPAFRYIPKIIEFLGYIPFETSAKSIGEKIITYRKLRGLSQKQLARQLGIDPGTLSKWERDKQKPSESFIKDLTEFFNSHISDT